MNNPTTNQKKVCPILLLGEAVCPCPCHTQTDDTSVWCPDCDKFHQTQVLLEKGAKHFAENFTDVIKELADE